MLGIDRQHAGKRKTKPGANPGISGGQRWRAIRSREPGAVVWLGDEPCGSKTTNAWHARAKGWCGCTWRK